MRAFIVVVINPLINISLQFFDTTIEFLAEGNLVEFVKNSLMESFTDAVRLMFS